MTKILFVCHGNICRSAAAEMIMKDLLQERGIRGVEAASAATSTEEIGNDVYPPMKRALFERGVRCTPHAARQLRAEDGERYDLIIGMDEENLWMMNRMLPASSREKIHLLMEYAGKPGREIDDPWYTRNFARAVEEIAAGCTGLLETICQSQRSERNP